MNRFTQPVNLAEQKTLSFQELAYAPNQLRQREDRLNAAQDEMLGKLQNVVGYEGFDEETNALKQNIQNKFNSLSEKIRKGGAGNQAYLNEFRNLKNEYNSLVSNTGAIGMSANLKSNMDQQKAAYFALAAERGQTNPETVEYNWNKEVEKFKSGIPGKIADLNGQLPQFSPMAPPKDISIPEYAADLAARLGSATDRYQKVTYETKYNENGEPYVVAKDVEGEEISNDENIAAVTRILTREVLDERSELNQNLRWKGYDVNEFMNTIDDLGASWSKNLSTERISEKAGAGAAGSSSSKTASSGGTKPGDDQINLVDSDRAHEDIPGTGSTKEILNKMYEVDRDVEGVYQGNEAAKNDMLTSLKFAYNLKKKDENSEVFQSAISNIMDQKGNVHFKGLKTFDDYKNKIATLKNTLHELGTNGVTAETKQKLQGAGVTAFNTNEPSVAIKSLSSVIENMEDQMDGFYDEASEGLQTNHLVTVDSDNYSFGVGKADEDVVKNYNTHANNNKALFISMAQNGLMEVEDDISEPFVRIPAGSDKSEDIKSLLEAEGTELTIQAISSGNDMTPPEVQYKIKDVNGNIKNITVDLLDNAFGREFIDENGPMYQNASPKTKAIIDTVRDNITYGGLATSNPKQFDRLRPGIPNNPFDETKTQNIQRYSNQRDKELLLGNPLDSNNPTGLDKIISEAKFIKNDGSKYAVIVNPDNSYSTMKRDKEGREIAYTIKDYFKKDLASNLARHKSGLKTSLNGHGKPIGFTEEYLESEEGKLMIEDRKIQMLEEMRESATDLNNPETNMTIYSSNSGFAHNMQEYNKLIQEGKNPYTDREARTAALKYFDRISEMRLSTKRRKYAL